MKRTIKCVGWTLGSAALFALGMGCSHEEKPAQTPPAAGATTPPFESAVPPGPGTQAQQPGMPPEQPMPPAPGAQTPPAPPAPPPPAAAPPEEKRGGMEQPGAPAIAGPSERQMCDTIVSTAKLHVEDVQNGVAIVMTPKAGHNLGAVRDDARQMENAMHRAPAEGQGAGETCGLMSIARLPGVATNMSEGMSTVRIVITTSNPAEVRDVRRAARDQVGNLMKKGGGNR